MDMNFQEVKKGLGKTYKWGFFILVVLILFSISRGCDSSNNSENNRTPSLTIETQGEGMTSLGPKNMRQMPLSWISPDASLEELVYAAEQNPVWIKLPEDMTIQMSFLQPEKDDFCWVLYPNGEFVLDRPGQHFAHQTPSKYKKKMVRPRGMNYVKILGGKGTYSIRATSPSR